MDSVETADEFLYLVVAGGVHVLGIVELVQFVLLEYVGLVLVVLWTSPLGYFGYGEALAG